MTQRMSPSQFSSLLVEGVAPFRINAAARSRRTSQCAGTSPSHSTPESLIRGYGFSPASIASPEEGFTDVSLRLSDKFGHIGHDAIEGAES